MKIFGAGKLVKPEEKDALLSYVFTHGLVDAITVGMLKTAEVDDTLDADEPGEHRLRRRRTRGAGQSLRTIRPNHSASPDDCTLARWSAGGNPQFSARHCVTIFALIRPYRMYMLSSPGRPPVIAALGQEQP